MAPTYYAYRSAWLPKLKFLVLPTMLGLIMLNLFFVFVQRRHGKRCNKVIESKQTVR